MANILKRVGKKGVSYKVQIRIKGISKTETFSTLADAKKWASIEEGKIQSSRSPLSTYTDHKAGEMIDRYIRDVLPQKKSHKIQHPQILWWRTKIGHLNISELRPSILAELRDELAARVANSTTNRYMSVLSHCFSVAVKDWEWMECNPMSRIRKMKEPKGRERFLSCEEIDRLLTACKKSKSKNLYLFTVLALSTGSRKNEILSLKWSDVDFSRQTIELNQTKNGESRLVPITEPALSMLKERKEWVTSPLVFPHKYIQKGWERAVQISGIADVHIHDLRHTCASLLLMSGTDLFTVGRILGHRDPSSTARYTHLNIPHLTQAIERMNSKLWQ